jgi:hypothetical protein
VRLAVNGVAYTLEKAYQRAAQKAAQRAASLREAANAIIKVKAGGSKEALLEHIEDVKLEHIEDVRRRVPSASAETEECAVSEAEARELLRAWTKGYVSCRECLYMMYDPVTTPCGHTFCRLCLERLAGEKWCCPQCHRELFIRPERRPPNAILSEMLELLWPDLLEVRQAEVAEARRSWERTQRDEMFIQFHDEVIFPGVRKALVVDKVGYWCWKGEFSVGWPTMLGVITRTKKKDGRASVGTAARLLYAVPVDAHRIKLVVYGLWRFSILEYGDNNGHLYAWGRRIHDIGREEEEEIEAEETSPCISRLTTREDIGRVPTGFLLRYAVDVIYHTKKFRPTKWAMYMDRYAMYYDDEDPPADPVKFPWWFASFTVEVSTDEKLRLLACISVRERLKIWWEWAFDCGLAPPLGGFDRSSGWNLRHQRCATM